MKIDITPHPSLFNRAFAWAHVEDLHVEQGDDGLVLHGDDALNRLVNAVAITYIEHGLAPRATEHDASSAWEHLEDDARELLKTLPQSLPFETAASRVADVLAHQAEECGVAPHMLAVFAAMTVQQREE